MTRMINAKRLAQLLRPFGFAYAFDLGDSFFRYARPHDSPQVYERIVISCGGKRGEKIGAFVEASVSYGLPIGGLCESRFLTETAAPNGKGVLLASPEEALAWERRLAEVAPAAVRTYADDKGPELLARTADARLAVGHYLELFDTSDWRDLWPKLELRATRNEVQEAERIARIPPTIQVFNGLPLYRAIVLGIILFSDQVEGRQIAPPGVEPWPGVDPWSKQPPDWSKWGLAWRIELLADRMLGRYPATLPSTLELPAQ